MLISFNVTLPDQDLNLRVGDDVAETPYGRSFIGYSNRQVTRFFPIVMCLEALVRINLWQLKRFAEAGSPLPGLYASGVYYKAEPAKVEIWQDMGAMYSQGFGDCEDLACARAAELQFGGTPAVPCIRFKEVSTPAGSVTLIHVMVLHPDGQVEDPSKMLGMRGEY